MNTSARQRQQSASRYFFRLKRQAIKVQNLDSLVSEIKKSNADISEIEVMDIIEHASSWARKGAT